MHRRPVLAGVAAAASLSGCLGSGDGGSAGGGDGAVHAAMATLEGQPYLGDPPAEAERLIVAFEDPTCPNCRRFHDDVLGDLRADVVEPASASFVWRPYRYTNYAWQSQAANAVLAATDRSNAAGWALVAFYYEQQSDLDAGNVLAETESFLAAETDVDAAAVATDAEERAFASLLETAESEGTEAGVSSTPTFFLFEGSEHRTTITGVQDAALFEAAFEA